MIRICLLITLVVFLTCFTASDASAGSLKATGDAWGVTLDGRWGADRPCNFLDAAGDMLAIGKGAYLVIYDITNPVVPLERSRLLTPGMVTGVRIDGSWIFVASGTEELQIVDATDPDNPQLCAQVPTNLYSLYLEVVDGVLYYLDMSGQLVYFDIDTPCTPGAVTRFEPGDNMRGIAADGSYVYTLFRIGMETVLGIIDVSGPDAPQVISSIVVDDGYQYGNELDVSGDVVYACCGEDLVSIDVSVPTAPAPLDTLFLIGAEILNVRVVGGHAFVVGNGKINVVDISMPAAMSLVSSLSVSEGRIYDIAVEGQTAWTAEGEFGLSGIDISVPSSPVPVSHIAGGGAPNLVHLGAGEGVVAVSSADGLVVLDVSDPQSPIDIGSWNPGVLWAGDFEFRGDIAYVGGNNGFYSVDFTDPTNPVVLDSLPRSCWSVDVAGDLAFVGEDFDDMKYLTIVDISNPSELDVIGDHELGETWGGIGDVINWNGLCAVADPALGLRLIDVSIPTAPIDAGYLDVNLHEPSLAVAEEYLYLGSGRVGFGLMAIEISDPEDPLIRGSWNIGGGVYDVEVFDGLIYVAANIDGLHILEAEDPDNLVEVGYYDTGGFASGVAVSSDKVYIADGSAGLWLFSTTLFSQVVEDQLPRIAILAQNSPNPFNPHTVIHFNLPEPETINLRIYDVSGRQVSSLVHMEEFDQGEHRRTWYGRDAEGREMAAGVYFYRLEAGDCVETRAMTLVK